MKDKKNCLFVYGTLRKGFDNNMASYLAANAEYIGEGTVKGRIYDTGGFPALIMSDSEADKVAGDVYLICKDKEVLKYIDHYEGYRADVTKYSLFLRERCDVVIEGGLLVNAWVYVFNHPVENLQIIECGDYMECRGKKDKCNFENSLTGGTV